MSVDDDDDDERQLFQIAAVQRVQRHTGLTHHF